jgi:hypothetical protein
LYVTCCYGIGFLCGNVLLYKLLGIIDTQCEKGSGSVKKFFQNDQELISCAVRQGDITEVNPSWQEKGWWGSIGC